MKNAHWSPFEKVRFEFAIKMPIFVARQMIRHRMASVNELSARYTELSNEYYVPTLSRMQEQAKSNKQCSGNALPIKVARAARQTIVSSCEASYESYTELLGLGLAREVARSVLPVNYYTEWYWTIDLRNLMNFIKLREDKHAQWEIQQYARELRALAEAVAPVAMESFTNLVP
jgi:thymidylate synthase (FAD)